jgi:GMP synthase PP-ATPase subunit
MFLRINGIQVTPYRVTVVQWADAEVMRIFREQGIYNEISQCPVNLNGVPTVGIKGDGRVYKYSIVIHPVQTMDFMTSIGYQIASPIRREITQTLQKHPEIVRVLYDEGDKPPASTEWE